MTPLSAYRLGDDFVLAVAYPKVDWCDNVLAAGTCTLTWNGNDYTLERPELISRAEAMKAYPLLVKPFIIVPAPNSSCGCIPRNQQRSRDFDIRPGEHGDGTGVRGVEGINRNDVDAELACWQPDGQFLMVPPETPTPGQPSVDFRQ